MRTIEEIYQALCSQFAQITGLTAAEGGDLSVRFYAVAAELFSLYAQAEWTRDQCFPQTAQGELLDLHGQLRGVTRREADWAQGFIRFSVDEVRDSPVPIAEGTVCMTAGQLRFVTVEAGTIEAGQLYTEVKAKAVEAGAAGNAAAGSILIMAVAPTAVSSCVNPEPFSGGRDREDDESLRERILETYARLANGANAAYYKQAALSFPQVVAAQVVPRSRGVGSVDVVAATQAGVPDEKLLKSIREHIQDMREIAVDVQVLAPTTVTVDVAITVEAAEGADGEYAVDQSEAAVRGWFTGERLGQSVRLAELTALVFRLPGIANCTITSPAADVAVSGTQLPVLGALSVTQAQ